MQRMVFFDIFMIFCFNIRQKMFYIQLLLNAKKEQMLKYMIYLYIILLSISDYGALESS